MLLLFGCILFELDVSLKDYLPAITAHPILHDRPFKADAIELLEAFFQEISLLHRVSLGVDPRTQDRKIAGDQAIPKKLLVLEEFLEAFLPVGLALVLNET